MVARRLTSHTLFLCDMNPSHISMTEFHMQGRIQSNVVGGCQNCWGCELDGAKRRRASAAEGAAAGVWGRKNRSPRVLECT